MPLLERKKGLAAKVESTYATDPTIAEADDSIQTSGLQVTPLDGDFVNRGLDRAVLGAEGDILVASRTLIQFAVEAAGSGAAGTAPQWGRLLKGCGFAETITADTSAAYAPVSGSFSSLWMEANHDGNQHVAKGARGNFSLQWATRKIPQLQFAFTGLHVAPSSVSLPTYTLTPFKVPEAFNNANTPTASLHSTSIRLQSIAVDVQNQIEHRDIIGIEEILIVDRNVRGQIVFEAPLISAKDWFAIAKARTQAALQVIHGDTAGNIIQLDAPKVELSNPRYSESQGVLMITMDMILVPSSGNDEFTITVS